MRSPDLALAQESIHKVHGQAKHFRLALPLVDDPQHPICYQFPVLRSNLTLLDVGHVVWNTGSKSVLVPEQVLEDSGVVELTRITHSHHCRWQRVCKGRRHWLLVGGCFVQFIGIQDFGADQAVILDDWTAASLVLTWTRTNHHVGHNVDCHHKTISSTGFKLKYETKNALSRLFYSTFSSHLLLVVELYESLLLTRSGSNSATEERHRNVSRAHSKHMILGRRSRRGGILSTPLQCQGVREERVRTAA